MDRHFITPPTMSKGRWANGILPYQISNDFTEDERMKIARVKTYN